MAQNANHILVGLGGSGGKVLKAFRKRLFQEFTPEERAKLPIGFVYVDSTDEMMLPGDKTWYVLGENAQFDTSEFVYIRGIALDQVFANPGGFPGLKGVVGDAEVMQKTIGSISAAAGQKRRAGRILFGANVEKYKSALMAQFNKTKAISGVDVTYIHIFCGLAGGTGSGAIVDVISQTRSIPQFRSDYKASGANSYEGTSIIAFCMVPEITPPEGCDAGFYHANGYAALQELNALLVGKFKPYDVSGLSPTGRLEFNGVEKIAGGLMLYTNVNENGVVVESHNELPQIVSDFAYARIFIESDENTREYIRAYSLENFDPYRTEFWEKAKNGGIVPWRSKDNSAFGIKRIVIPDEEIKEYFTYTLGRQALLQLKYNNWNDDSGFLNKPFNVSWIEYVRGDDPKLGNPLENWHATDKHLMLELPILPSDEGKWGTFSSYWTKVIPRWLIDASTTKQPIAKLNEFCSKGLASGFRGVGVKEFFEAKKEAREQQAAEIVERIERGVFTQWEEGRLSLYNLGELIDTLVTETQKRIGAFESKAVKLHQFADKLEADRQNAANEYNRAGLIMGALKGKKMLADYSEIMVKICTTKTQIEGTAFALDLLHLLVVQLNLLRTRVERFVSLLNSAIEDTEQQIAVRCKDGSGIDNMQAAVIRFYEPGRVKDFADRMTRNKKNQESISAAVRHDISSLIGSDKTFARANAEIDLESLNAIFDKTVRDKVVAIHDATLVENHDKLINRSILEQLSEKISGPEELKNFASKVMKESGVMLKFNASEAALTVPNNKVTQVGETVLRKIILIYLPKVQGNEKTMAFAGKLKSALESAADAGVKVSVSMSGDRHNEITVMSITSCFPSRVIDNLTFYKEKYDFLTKSASESIARENRTILHIEGSGSDYPDLFLEPEKQKSQLRDEFTPYLIIASAMGLIKYADREDGTGKSAYGTVTINRMGREVLNPISDKFSLIGFSEAFTEDFCEELKKSVLEKMKGDYLNVTKRKELLPVIQELVGKTILAECGGNSGTVEYRGFEKAGETAMDILEI